MKNFLQPLAKALALTLTMFLATGIIITLTTAAIGVGFFFIAFITVGSMYFATRDSKGVVRAGLKKKKYNSPLRSIAKAIAITFALMVTLELIVGYYLPNLFYICVFLISALLFALHDADPKVRKGITMKKYIMPCAKAVALALASFITVKPFFINTIGGIFFLAVFVVSMVYFARSNIRLMARKGFAMNSDLKPLYKAIGLLFLFDLVLSDVNKLEIGGSVVLLLLVMVVAVNFMYFAPRNVDSMIRESAVMKKYIRPMAQAFAFTFIMVFISENFLHDEVGSIFFFALFWVSTLYFATHKYVLHTYRLWIYGLRQQ